MKKRVAIIFGGEGCERSISQMSAANVIDLLGARYELLPIGINSLGEWYIYGGDGDKIATGEWETSSYRAPTFPIKLSDKSGFLYGDRVIPVDVALPVLHGDFGEDGAVQGALTLAHIPYVGQSVYAAAVCQDKVFSKILAKSIGVPVARWVHIVNEDLHTAQARAEEIGYPMFIKPTRLGSSHGAARVGCKEDFEGAFLTARELSPEGVLIEELVDVDYELECAFFENGEAHFSPRGVIKRADVFYSFEEKYEKGDTGRATVAEPDEGIGEKIVDYSEKLVRLFGVRHLSRLDFFVSRTGEIYFNEINTIPGMTKTSLYPRLTEELGLARGEFLERLIEKTVADDWRL